MVPICLYCLNCTKFGQLILRKIIKIVATRCQILRLKCTKFDFGPTSKRREGTGEKGRGEYRRKREGMGGRRGEGRGGEGRERGPRASPQLQICHYTTEHEQ